MNGNPFSDCVPALGGRGEEPTFQQPLYHDPRLVTASIDGRRCQQQRRPPTAAGAAAAGGATTVDGRELS